MPQEEQVKPPTTSDFMELMFYGNLDAIVNDNAKKGQYLTQLCKVLDLNPATKPFDILVLNGKATVYANKGCASQLREKRGITVRTQYAGPLMMGSTLDANGIAMPVYNNDVYEVRVVASTPDGRETPNVGSVYIGSSKGESLSNGIMRAYTKATRRVTLDHAGIGFPDESELDSIPGYQQKEALSAPKTIVPAASPNQSAGPNIGQGGPGQPSTTGIVGGTSMKPATPPITIPPKKSGV